MTYSHFLSALMASTSALVSLFFATAPLVVAAALSTEPTLQADDSAPSPALAPSEVVRIQVEALRSNTSLNEGIELTYRFASPSNKNNTGPLNRFTEMVGSAPYDRLLNHLSARYSPVAISNDEAQQMVIVTDKEGEEIAFVWVLSRQREGAFKDCWMTDAVLPAERPAQRRLTEALSPLQTALGASQSQVTWHDAWDLLPKPRPN